MLRTTDRPIFVVGCARSGTTLLQAMIHSHPRLAMPPENRFLMSVYRRRAQFGDLRQPENVDAVAHAVINDKSSKFRDLGLKADPTRTRMHEVPPTMGSLLGSVLEGYARRSDKQRWGDKRPNYIQHLDVLLELFPDAQIVHVIRDGRDCVASLKQMPWWTFGYPASVYKWARAIDVGLDARARLRPDQYHEIRYEDLIADPRRHLSALCDFLGEELNEAMLEHHRDAEKKVPDYKDWHQQVRRPLTGTAVQRWRRDLDEQEIKLFEHVAWRQMEAVGYSPSLSGLRRVPSARSMWAYRSFVRRRSHRERTWAAEDAAAAAGYRFPVAALLTSGQRQIARERGYDHLLRACASSADMPSPQR